MDKQAPARVLQENIRQLYAHREEHRQSMSTYESAANSIADYCGRASFVLFHAVFFLAWIGANIRVFGNEPFDPYPFGLLTTIVSLEAIFLSLFVLLSQSRMQKLTDRQNELDLQVNLLTEHELTRVLIAVDRIAERLGIDIKQEIGDIAELERDTTPEDVLEAIEREDDR
ncbi:MAG: hypothetical protein HONBIEJF_00193 [Fimbriimonadaceae bacterium]|nr:hypothetical protein [Fimbriimonadaceae bacterium]